MTSRVVSALASMRSHVVLALASMAYRVVSALARMTDDELLGILISSCGRPNLDRNHRNTQQPVLRGGRVCAGVSASTTQVFASTSASDVTSVGILLVSCNLMVHIHLYYGEPLKRCFVAQSYSLIVVLLAFLACTCFSIFLVPAGSTHPAPPYPPDLPFPAHMDDNENTQALPLTNHVHTRTYIRTPTPTPALPSAHALAIT
jgi:hypothetical protein